MLLYLKYFPDGPHAGLALRRLQEPEGAAKPEVAALPSCLLPPRPGSRRRRHRQYRQHRHRLLQPYPLRAMSL